MWPNIVLILYLLGFVGTGVFALSNTPREAAFKWIGSSVVMAIIWPLFWLTAAIVGFRRFSAARYEVNKLLNEIRGRKDALGNFEQRAQKAVSEHDKVLDIVVRQNKLQAELCTAYLTLIKQLMALRTDCNDNGNIGMVFKLTMILVDVEAKARDYGERNSTLGNEAQAMVKKLAAEMAQHAGKPN